MADEEKRNLKRRYLFWLYKTLKESLDRIDRKFTQLEIDKKIFKSLEKIKADCRNSEWQRLLKDFKSYIDKKETDAVAQKFSDFPKYLKADYLFWKNKLRIVEGLIQKEFGVKELKRIKLLYEDEMFKRILQDREHR